jgi:hypothetical protein
LSLKIAAEQRAARHRGEIRNVYRDALAVDTFDEAEIYSGTGGGQVYVATDSGDAWAPIARDLPALL